VSQVFVAERKPRAIRDDDNDGDDDTERRRDDDDDDVDAGRLHQQVRSARSSQSNDCS
jgi:hypothetical protein